MSVYLGRELNDALDHYRAAGHAINVSRTVQQVLVEKFIIIERARRATGEPFVFTPIQLAGMKNKVSENGEG